jgi:prophage maintenance system killer protein
MLALLKEYDIELAVEEDDLYSFIVSMSTGQNKFDQIVVWLHEQINK